MHLFVNFLRFNSFSRDYSDFQILKQVLDDRNSILLV